MPRRPMRTDRGRDSAGLYAIRAGQNARPAPTRPQRLPHEANRGGRRRAAPTFTVR